MKRFLFQVFVFLLLPTTWTFAQVDSAMYNFPEAWSGIWEGELGIYNAKGLAQSIPMELHILPIEDSDKYTWKIIYGEDKEAGARPYILEAVNAQLGHFRVDEQNTIFLDSYLLDGKLYERFEVMGNLLLTMTELREPDLLVWEIISGPLDPFNKTGDAVHEGDTIPPVNSYKINVMQRAFLKRQK